MNVRNIIIILLFLTSTVFGQTVHVTRTGSRYHRDWCHHLRRSNYSIALKDAIGYYDPCKDCGPPTRVVRHSRKKKNKSYKKPSERIPDSPPVQNITRYYIAGKQVTEQEYENYKVDQNKDLVNKIFTDDFKNQLKEKIRIKLQASYDSGVVDGGRLCEIKLDSLSKVIYQKNILIDSLRRI